MELSVLIGIFLAIAGALGKLFKSNSSLDAKMSILWEAYKEEARADTRRRGTMERASEERLTKQGLDLISPELKQEIKELVSHKKLNPKKVTTWQVIEKLGGISRLSYEAEKVGVELKEMIVMTETYIQRHLEE